MANLKKCWTNSFGEASPIRSVRIATPTAAGFSLVELLVVITILAILSGVAYLGFAAPQKFAADDQALRMLDIMQEARQKALTQKRVMRVEISDTKKQIRLINEYDIVATNGTTGKTLVKDSDDDKEIRSMYFATNLATGNKPGNVTTVVPTLGVSIPELTFATTIYPLSNGDSVHTLCFVKDGRVLNPGPNGLCESADDLGGVTIYVSSKPGANGKSEIVRALTVNPINGAADIVKCQLDAGGQCVKWVR